MEFYGSGHSVKETAERFGFTKADVNNFVKVRGISNGRSFIEAGISTNRSEAAKAERRLSIMLDEKGFLYIGGYTERRGSAKIKCKECGSEFERTVDFLKRGNAICIECKKKETQKRQDENRKRRLEQAEVKALEKEWYRRFHPPKDAYSSMHEAFLDRSGICEICGAPYTVRSYVESCGLKQARDNGVCSDKCRRIKANKSVHASHKRRGIRDSHRHRARKYGVEYDSRVTLPGLIKRDGLRCAICGDMCDPNDRSWSTYCGPLYPSIDHIIPMSKGGGHTWDNVQIAHIICNSIKGNGGE